MHPITFLAFVVLAAVALVAVTARAPVPQVAALAAAQAGPLQRAAVAAPNHDKDRTSLVQQPEKEFVAPEIDAPEAVATADHAPRPHTPAPSLALSPVTLQAAPEPAPQVAPQAAPPEDATFVEAATLLYSKEKARLRAAPSTEAEVLKQLAADVKLRASARSTDGVWWRVPLGDGRIGYVHKTAVSKNRVATKTTPAAPTTPVAAVAAKPAQQAPERGRDGVLGYVEETMDWLADQAGTGPAPKTVRPER